MPEPVKRIYRSRTESQLAGICGGAGLHFGVDPVLMRLAVVAVTLCTGLLPGILFYLAAWLIIPAEPMPPATVQQPTAQQSGNA